MYTMDSETVGVFPVTPQQSHTANQKVFNSLSIVLSLGIKFTFRQCLFLLVGVVYRSMTAHINTCVPEEQDSYSVNVKKQ